MKITPQQMNSAKTSLNGTKAALAFAGLGVGTAVISHILLTSIVVPARAMQTAVQPMIMGQNYYQQKEAEQFTLNSNQINIISGSSWILGIFSALISGVAAWHFAKK